LTDTTATSNQVSIQSALQNKLNIKGVGKPTPFLLS
jgi:hypothetical protein